MTIQHFAYSTSPNRDVGVLVASTFEPLTLRGGAVEVEVWGNCARVHVRYEYDNYTGRDQRVIAVHPLPAAWDLMGCRAEYFADCVLTDYAATVPLRSSAEAGAAGLLGPTADRAAWTVASQMLPWVVGTGTTVLIAATYHVPLDTTRWRGVVQIQLPAELFPEGKAPPQSTLEYDELFGMKLQSKLPSGWTIQAKCDLFMPLAGTVRLKPLEDETLAKVEYIGDSSFTLHYAAPFTTRMRNGFAIECVVQETSEPLRFFLAKDVGAMVSDADSCALTLCLTPHLEGKRGCLTNAELVLVVDSHSYQSSEAMAHGILVGMRGLPDSVFLNVVIVGEKKETALCPRGAVPLRNVKFDQISTFVAEAKPQEANTGASHLHRTLREVMSTEKLSLCGPVPTAYVRHVIVMSDEGDTKYATEIIEAATRHRHNMCFSAIGLMSSGTLDAPTLRLLAEEGGGLYRDAADGKELPEVLVDILSRVAVPTLTDIVVRFDEPEVRLSIGKTLSAVAQGTQRFLHALAPASMKTLGVYATGCIGSTVIEYVGKGNVEEPVLTSKTEPHSPLCIGLFHLAAASARMRYLVDSREITALSLPEMEEVVRLSKTFYLPSPYTEMLQFRPAAAATTDTQKQTAPTVVALRYIPRSWTYAQTMMRYRRERLANGLIDGRPKPQHRETQEGGGKEGNEKQKETLMPPCVQASFVPPIPSREFIRAIVLDVAESVLGGPNLERLTALQSVDGSFPLNSLLGVSVGVSLERMEREFLLTDFGISEDFTAAKEYLRIHERVWATAIATAAMEKKPSATTVMAYRMALAYVMKNGTEGDLLSRARDLLKSPSLSL